MRVAYAVAALASLAMLPLSALAGDVAPRPKPTKQEQAAAAKRFKEGERAYARHDYAAAAAAFEEAYAVAPHPDALLNAADARKKAGDLSTAAAHCVRLLREHPEGKVAADARKRLAELRPKLTRLDVTAPDGAEELRVDGEPAELGELYVDPGDHLLSVKVGGQKIERSVSAVAGARIAVRLEVPPQPKEEQAAAAPSPPPAAPKEEKPLHPAVFFTGLGLTAVAGGLLIWSGVDTQAARSDFDASPTREAYDDGLQKELRTNVLIGVTGGLGAITAVLGIFATEWGGGAAEPAGAAVSLQLSPTEAAVRGRF